MGKKGKFALGALFGAAVGVVTGILAAPKSGKETRTDLRNKADEIKTEAIKNAQAMTEKAEKVATDVKTKADQMASEAKMNAVDLKERADLAVKGAKKGFFEKK